jgi:type IV pilus assembly protein PilA
MNRQGFTLIELMIVVAIIAFLTTLALPSFNKFLAKSKRTEAYMNLSSLYAAQKAHWAEHGTYTTQLKGPQGIGWSPEGYKGGGAKENFYYTYGFGSGAEGVNHFTGKLETPASYLSNGYANKEGFLIFAAGDILGNGKPDVLSVDHHNTITIVSDALS